ncbi:MAG: ornithine carbamoyltransferase, partial [Deltaproteobacteria bacterium]|nr:ornithine carbamoyltransferase [Deltaproteobacteria bacterium]
HDNLEELARYAGIPIINGLSDLYHPCQVLTDMFTIIEHKGNLSDIKVAWVGDGNNMAHSWITAAAHYGFELWLACPPGFEPRPDILKQARARSKHRIELVTDPQKAVAGAAAINTDVWVSMGQKDEAGEKIKLFEPYQINAQLLAQAESGAIVLHCLPAYRGQEITDEVMDGPQSVVFQQSTNRMHLQKALLEKLLVGGE